MGNLYSSEVEIPRVDAGSGLYLKGDGTGNFEAKPARVSGLYAPGDVKDFKMIKIKNIFLLLRIIDFIQFIEYNLIK